MIEIERIKEFLSTSGISYREDVTGAECTTFKTGGPIALFAEPSTKERMCSVLEYAEKERIPYFLIGNGSNLLIPDEGLDMLFIKPCGELSVFRIKGDTLICGAGASLAAAAKYSVYNGFSGLEWASGIPGTVGGAVAMNAGAYGGEISDQLDAVTIYADGSLVREKASISEMGYRRSPYSFPDCVVLEAEFKLAPDDGTAKARMDEFSARRKAKQPLNFPSAGSTFKRPEGYYAGALIEKAGLKGASVGGARVSEKHAGFIVNAGGATSDDVKKLIELVQETVCSKFGVTLEPEVKIL